LGRQKAVGLAYTDIRRILLDERLTGFDYLETAVHEILHCQNPKFSEEQVTAQGFEMADLLWKLGFRKVDNARRKIR